MKRFLCAGEGYGLFSSNINSKFPRCFPTCFVPLAIAFLTLIYSPASLAQENQALDKNKYEIPPGGVVIGEKVPDWFWELKFHTVVHPKNHSFVQLKNYKDKLLVIDFWAPWCKPCVASVDKWEGIYKDFRNELEVLAVFAFDFPEKAKPFAEKKGWTLPVVVGPADSLINRLFYTNYRYGQIWIKDNKLIAIPMSNSVTRDNIIKVIRRLPHEIEMNSTLTHFDPRYELGKGGNDENK
ncbi:MAG: TlpA disulfide reductase family protein [Anaerolineaceae bacterium]